MDGHKTMSIDAVALARIVWKWDGSHMVPIARFVPTCNRILVAGEQYILDVHEERSLRSQGHYFARLKEIWESLPEGMAERFPNVDSLRAWCLCKAGVCTTTDHPYQSEAAAMAALPYHRSAHPYAVIVRYEATVRVSIAKSQRANAMDRAEFESSKQAVLRIAEDLLDGGR